MTLTVLSWAVLGAALLSVVGARVVTRSDRGSDRRSLPALSVHTNISARTEGDRFRAALWLALAYGLLTWLLPRFSLSSTARDDLEALQLLFGVLSIVRVGVVIVVDLLVPALRKEAPNELTRDIAHTFSYIITIFICLREAGFTLTSILTTGTILSAIVGLSLQDTLGNLASGMAIQLEKPIAAGDWIRIDKDDQTGRVVDTNWRSVVLQTDDRSYVVIPNSVFSKTAFINYSRPGDAARRSLYVTIPHHIPPSEVHRALLAACEGCEVVLREPAPSVVTQSFNENGVTYWLRFFIRDFAARDRNFGLLATRVWYQLNRAKIPIANTIQQHFVHKVSSITEEEEHQARIKDRLSAISRIDFLRPLSEEGKRTLAERGHRRLYATNEVIVGASETPGMFWLVRRGEVSLRRNAVELAHLKEGDFFGELALLTGSSMGIEAVALTEVQVLEINEPLFREVLAGDPKIAAEISQIVAERESKLAAQEDSDPMSIRGAPPSKGDLLAKILGFFGVS